MTYEQMVERVREQAGLASQQEAAAALKSVAGHLASRLTEDEAHYLTSRLPGELSYERLRGHQVHTEGTPVNREQMVQDVSDQFNLDHDRTVRLVKVVFQVLEEHLGAPDSQRVRSEVPQDWQQLL